MPVAVTVSISDTKIRKSEASSTECRREILSVIDEKHGVFDIVFQLKLPQKCCVNAVLVVVGSRICGKSFVSELTAATAKTVGH